ncbi:MAG: hypothetical protein CFH34_00969, partial [Alphaproteobacteria bacterium MarineAlpha9_Bin4]
IGPKTANQNTLKKMYFAGMSVARLNGSHNTLIWHKNTIKLIKKCIPDCPILLDIPGKKIRTAKLEYEPIFNIGDQLIISTEEGHNGKKKISITNNQLHNFLKKGDIVFADDGTLKFTVKKIIKKDIYLIANTKGKLKSSKGINVPHVSLGGELVTTRDKKMIKFAVENKVDFIGLSFIESGKHLRKIRSIIKGSIPKIVAKVENQAGINNLEEIIEQTDCVMIDRGDLSTETNIETLAINQKKIIKASLRASKPVIVATEMLDNMILNPYPTKAEVLDISNSILDGATATMLSGETAVGNYPLDALKVMSKIANSTINHKDLFNFNNSTTNNKLEDGTAIAIRNLCLYLPITKIVAITVSGFAARIISSQMIPQPILAVSNNKDLARGFNIFAGSKGIFYNTKFYKNSLEHIPKCINYLYKIKEITAKDMILVTALGYPSLGRRMNLIQTHYVKDLIKTFSWK